MIQVLDLQGTALTLALSLLPILQLFTKSTCGMSVKKLGHQRFKPLIPHPAGLREFCPEMGNAFSQAAEDFEVENMNRCNVQQQSAEDYANRRQRQLQERIQRFQEGGNLRMIPATEGLLNKVNRELELKRRAISERRDVSLDCKQLAAGLIFIQ